MTDGIEQYTWQGDTWYVAERICPHCGGHTTSNGTIHRCNDCSWWALIEDTDQ